MKNISKLILCILILNTLTVSCKKDKDDPNPVIPCSNPYPAPQIGNNSPIDPVGDILMLSVTQVPEATEYNWILPDGSIHTGMELQIFNPNVCSHSGQYKVSYKTANNCTSEVATTEVTFNPPTVPCTVSQNKITRVGTTDFDFTNAVFTSQVNGNNQYEIFLIDGQQTFSVSFGSPIKPKTGVYDVNSFDPIHFSCFLFMKYNQPQVAGFHANASSGKAYVINNNGKISVSFCNITFDDWSADYLCSGNITEP